MLEGVEAEPVPTHGMVDEVRRLARERFGIPRLHREQERAILSVLGGKDTLLILPTGGGKSLCYQLPSLLIDRPTVVVSPLLALLEDQHQKLIEYDIPAIRLDSTVGVVERRESLARLKKGGSLLVLTTPETLAGKELGTLLKANPPGLVAVDEAHCISEWGHDFRPAYLALGQCLANLGAGQVLALTATATQPVRDDILRYLGLRDPEIIIASPHRHNLLFEVRDVRGDEKLRQLAKLARRLPRPGIIYCSTTKAVDDVWLGLRLIKIPTARYHGKMTDKDRTEHQGRFMTKGKRIVMVATSAFGLGIDKPDIRYIIHYQAPASLERYLQESGRAGRDGHQARCILLFDESDLAIQEHLLALSRLSPALLGKFGRALAAYAGEERDANIEELALSAGLSQRATTSIGTALVEAGICERVADKIRALGDLDTLVERVESLRSRFEVLRREDERRLRAVSEYANETHCRSQMLRRYFGDVDPHACGRCDQCRANGAVEPNRPGRRRRRRRGGEHAAGQPAQTPSPARAALAAPSSVRGRDARHESHQDPNDRRRRRRRRGRRVPDQAAAPPPSTPMIAMPPPPLEPLDAAADELAAELGAPGLPPPEAESHAAGAVGAAGAVSAGVEGAGRRRRRRRRRGHGARPRDAASPQT